MCCYYSKFFCFPCIISFQMKFFPLIFILFSLFAFHLLFANFFKYIFSTFHFWLIFAFKPLHVHAYVYGIFPPFHLLFSFHVLILHILVIFTFTLLINSFPFLSKIFFWPFDCCCHFIFKSLILFLFCFYVFMLFIFLSSFSSSLSCGVDISFSFILIIFFNNWCSYVTLFLFFALFLSYCKKYSMLIFVFFFYCPSLFPLVLFLLFNWKNSFWLIMLSCYNLIWSIKFDFMHSCYSFILF
jgi:hypothetical protein